MVAAINQKTLQGHSPIFPGQNLWRNLRIGLLGGSFNPAHEGHVHISLEAMKRLNLDWVWWLVSPQNPLKSVKELAPYENRLATAKQLASSHPVIHVSDVERHFGTNKTIDTLTTLKTACPENQFVWLMGADNMAQFDQWASWQDIVSLVPIAILDRSGYSTKALHGKFAKRYAHLRVLPYEAKSLGRIKNKKATPLENKNWDKDITVNPDDEHMMKQENAIGWVFLPCPRHKQSSTNIRNLANKTIN